MPDTAKYVAANEDLERIALKRKEEERLDAMQPIERNLCQNGAKLADYTFDGIRKYERRIGGMILTSFVYDGRLDEEAVSQLAKLSNISSGIIVFYSRTKNPKRGPEIIGNNPADTKYFRENYFQSPEFTGNQVSVEVHSFGNLEETSIEAAKTILEKARKRAPQKL